MFGGLGAPELIIILIIVLVIFGAGKLPEIGGALGKGIRNFKKSVSESPEKEKDSETKKIEENKQT
jgi:sec-independent protein translocase protein TatA